MKKLLTLLLAALLLLSACGGDASPSQDSSKDQELDLDANKAKNDDSKDIITIGISQFARHGSLDNIRQGFIGKLKESGYEEGNNLIIDYHNADASIDMANQIAMNFVSKKVDLIVAIATPSAMAAYSQTRNTDIPLIYSAISDPIEAKLAQTDKSPIAKATGTSDALPVRAQLEMIREILPEAKKLGILYTISEANSVSTIRTYESLVADFGFELVTSGISSQSEIALASDQLLSKVDAITNLTDNTVVNALPTILQKASEKKVPVFGSEIEQVRVGTLAAMGVDYLALGQKTADMALAVLKGEDISNMPFESIEGANLYINKKVADELGIALEADYMKQAVEVFD